MASTVSLIEREYSHSRPVVTPKAITKNSSTVVRPSITSPITLAKPTMWMSICSLAWAVRIASSFSATEA